MQYKNLSELRDAKRFTQRDVAEKLGMTPQGYGLIERGERELKVKTATVLADLFGAAVADIIFLSLQNNKNLLESTGTEGN
jgi:transcriptional regulator with XRE-family HTH domain